MSDTETNVEEKVVESDNHDDKNTSDKEEDNLPSLHVTKPPQFQLVFGMDDEESESSLTSPYIAEEDGEKSNPLLSYHNEIIEQSNNLLSEGNTSLENDKNTSSENDKNTSSENVIDGVNTSVLSKDLMDHQTEEDTGSDSKLLVQDVIDHPLAGGEDLDETLTEETSINDEETEIKQEKNQTTQSELMPSPLLPIAQRYPSYNSSLPSPTNISPSSSLSSSSLQPELFKTQSQEGVSFNGIQYLGSSTVDAPVSETEANRKMSILKSQAGQPIPIILSIPSNNAGNIVLKDPATNQILAAFCIKHVLFCARGELGSDLNDCMALNVLHKRSGVYHCHVFICTIPEACERVFVAIGRAFKLKPRSANTPVQMTFDLDVTVDIQEEDTKGNFNSVSMERDIFKLRPQVRKKVLFTVSQSIHGNNKQLPFERCFGLLMAVGKDVKRNEMNLLDNMQTTTAGSSDMVSFIVAGFWDTTLKFLYQLVEEPAKNLKYHYLTVAADLVAEGISDPLRLTRVLKVRFGKGDSFSGILSTLTKRKLPLETFILSLETKPGSLGQTKGTVRYVVKSLKSNLESSNISPPPGVKDRIEIGKVVDECSTPSPSLKKSGRDRLKEVDNGEDSDTSQTVDELDEGDVLVSGWGDDDNDLNDDLLKQWSDMLERWDGRDKWDPKGDKPRSKQLCKLVRKGIPSPLRCQIWQMLSGADNDPQLLEAFRILVTKDSPTENVITWDIKRTYVGHEFFQDEHSSGKEALYKISKAYSVYDEEVGYCQGFSFMAAVLLLQKMPEEQAFAVLVKMMFNYGHRNVFKSSFKELHLMFYQLERLVDEYLHELHEHFISKSIETHMYCSQWFLTIFTAKFPLNVTYQIMDMFLCEGVPIEFQIALSLLKLTQHDLMSLDFEGILNYFRVNLPKRFSNEEECRNLFKIAQSYSNKITQRKLKKLEKDYQLFLEHQAQLEDPVVRMERENKQLQETVLRLQRENDDLAGELVSSKVALRADMDKLEERIDILSKECRAQKSSSDAANLFIHELKEELQEAKETYQRAMIQLAEERQQHEVAVSEYKQLFQQLDEGHQKQKEELNQELLEVKAQLGSQSSGSLSDHKTSLTSEQRLRQVELELAQTKLALVEAQCKNQELEHTVQEVKSELTHAKGKQSWLARFN